MRALSFHPRLPDAHLGSRFATTRRRSRFRDSTTSSKSETQTGVVPRSALGRAGRSRRRASRTTGCRRAVRALGAAHRGIVVVGVLRAHRRGVRAAYRARALGRPHDEVALRTRHALASQTTTVGRLPDDEGVGRSAGRGGRRETRDVVWPVLCGDVHGGRRIDRSVRHRPVRCLAIGCERLPAAAKGQSPRHHCGDPSQAERAHVRHAYHGARGRAANRGSDMTPINSW
jgi:hypothetical protein